MSHWTEELFKEHPELFLGTFEKPLAQASGEINVLLKHLKKHGFEPQTILDLNCGIGRHAIELGKRGIQVLGTDISRQYIKIAQRTAQEANVTNKVNFQVADMREIASILQEQNPFDGIVNLWTSFGFYSEEINKEILRQCWTLVRPGGFLALETVSKDWFFQNFRDRDFEEISGILLLAKRWFTPEDSRMHETCTYLRRKDENIFVLEKEIAIDYRVWNLDELIQLFKETGWHFKKAYPRMEEESNISPIESDRLLVIGAKE